VVRSGVQVPRMNAIMERWVRTCRRELLDRTLIWNQPHLLHALRAYEALYNAHRPHQGIANARPLAPLPDRSPNLTNSPGYASAAVIASAEPCTNMNTPLDQHG
ncbi:MAG TPA: integrase core domain-containing protein, partial [Kribbellaceae bacterium]